MKLASMANYQQDGIISVEYDPITGTGSAKVMINGQEINIGGGSAMLICKVVEGALDKNIGEVYDAYMAGSAVVLESNTDDTGAGTWSALQAIEIYISENTYSSTVTFTNNMLVANTYASLEELRAAYPVFSD